MDALKKVALKGLQKNKKRTVVTLVGIILATALITAVANLAESFCASMVVYQKNSSGDFHYCFQGVKSESLKYFINNRSIEKIGYEKDLGYALLPDSTNPDKPYLFVKAMDNNAMKAAALKLVKGRMPQTAEEIVISNHIRSNGDVGIAVGDVLELNLGYRDAGGGNILNQSNPYSYEAETFIGEGTKTYTVVGIIERPSYLTVESYTAPGYTVVTFMEDSELAEVINSKGMAETNCQEMNLYVTYTKAALKNKEQVTAGLLGVSEELYEKYSQGRLADAEEWAQIENIASNIINNHWLMQWELLDFSNNTSNLLYAMATVAISIIIVTSAFCIHNSFMISLSEKMRLYGMISSIGATKKQRRKMVYTEAVYLGAAGIPLGVLCGVAATFLLVKFTSRLMVMAVGRALVYVVSVPAMIVGAVLAVVTIFLSAGRAAGKAGRLSPISAIRGSDTIKIKARELRTPGFIHRFFGIGGTVAYKNLRRSRGKYRTTVISIVVSISVFIAMTTFIQLAFKAGSIYYKSKDYQLMVSIREYSRQNYQKALEITQMDGVTYGEAQRSMSIRVENKDIPFSSKYLEDFSKHKSFEADAWGFTIISLKEDAYEAYLKKVGVSTAQAKDKAVLVAHYGAYVFKDEKGNSKYVEGMKYDYHSGDILTGILMKGTDLDTEKEIKLELAAQTDINPLGHMSNGSAGGLLVVNDEWMDQYEEYITEPIDIYLQCEDANDLETRIRNEADSPRMLINNEQRAYEEDRAIHLLIAIFLYGFIAVIALIGITNIFNTVTTNMELRSREFAMLRAIGMTDREFRRLIQLESLFYGVKALAIGIPLGILLSFCFHRALAKGIETAFTAPILGIVISIVAVFLLLNGIMRYSMGKIGQKNLIQTIQNENI